jgi:DNA-binding transcriptional LysR family regulator
MDPFSGLPELIAVAETRGFATAARRLGVSTSHVSRRVAALEARLGVLLVARTTRRVALTEIGRDYYERGVELLHGVTEADRIASGASDELDGRLRISAPADCAELVAPALVRFAAAHPQIDLDLDFSPRQVNLVEEGFDLAIRFGAMPDSDLIAHKLAEVRTIAAAAPAYLRAHGTPRRPADLSRHQCLITATDRWRFAGDVEVRVRGRWRSNSSHAAVAACRGGLGIAYLAEVAYGTALTDGELVRLLPKHAGRATAWIVYPTRRFMPRRTRRMIDDLLAHFADWRIT